MEPCCYIGRGKIYIQKHGTGCPTTLVPWTTPLVDVGNTERLELNVEVDTKSLKNFTNAAGGERCRYTEITSVNLELDTSCFSAKSLQLAIAGAVSESASTAVTDEPHQVNSADDFVPFDFKYDNTQTVTVTDDPNTTTYTEGTDYSLTPNGIKIISGGGISSGDAILVSYTSADSSKVEIAVSSADNYTIVFDGINVAEGSEPMYLKLYNVKFDPTSLPFIGDDFARVNLTGSLLPWSCITPSGTISDYGIIRL